MHRLLLVTAITLPLIGCELFLDINDDNQDDDDGDVGTPEPRPGEESLPRDVFNRDVLPLLDQRCAACHGGSRAGIAFMAFGATVHESVLAWPALVQIDPISDSRLLTKGQHDGPAWTAREVNLIIGWLQFEAEFGPQDRF